MHPALQGLIREVNACFHTGESDSELKVYRNVCGINIFYTVLTKVAGGTGRIPDLRDGSNRREGGLIYGLPGMKKGRC